jgi:hypothetical protein
VVLSTGHPACFSFRDAAASTNRVQSEFSPLVTLPPEGRAREHIVDRLCTAAEQRGITVLRDKKVIGLGDRISKYMQRLGRGDRIFVVLSDKCGFRRSRPCIPI